MPANISNVNSAMGFTQASTLLNSIVQQMTGKASLAATNTSGFVSQAQTALLSGADPLCNALSQVLSKTLFSIRPYDAKFVDVQRDAIAWGNHVRKINYASDGVANIDKYDLTDGNSVDQQIVKKPNVLQTNFYSRDSYQDFYTIPRDQLNLAFSSPEEFSRFITGITTEVSNKLESYRESWARLAMLNFIGACINLGRVRHMLTEYATAFGITSGGNPDPTAVLPNHMDGFTKWLFAEIRTMSDRMTHRSVEYQTNVTGHDIYRHTPKEFQRLYMYAPFMAQVDARVLSAVFNPGYLNIGRREDVAYWQNITAANADKVSITPSQINPSTGAYAAGSAVSNKSVLGVLMDYEAVGTTQMSESLEPAPYNARGKYTTMWYSAEFRAWNDLTEKGVVFLLD